MHKTKLKIFIVLLFTGLLVFTGHMESKKLQGDILRIKVIDLQQNPIKGAVVILKSDSFQKKMMRKLTTDDGIVEFDQLPGGNYCDISVTRKGFYSQTKNKVTIFKGERTIEVQLWVNQEDSPGRWRLARNIDTNAHLTKKQLAQKKKLESLGYLSSHRSKTDKKNVTIFDKNKAYIGLNLYCSGHGPEAILMDMEGKQLHKWHYEMKKIWKDTYDPYNSAHRYWRRVFLLDDGQLLAIFEGVGLIKLDKNSNLMWSYNGKVHHDVHIMPDGRIFALTREAVLNPKYNKEKMILEDFIVVLSPKGKEIKRVSILEALEKSSYRAILNKRQEWGDFLHTNTLEVLEGKLASKSPAFQKGNVLISILKLDFIGIIDMDQKTCVWGMSEMWKRQHQPSILDNGNVLIFDNQWDGSHRSRVIEFNPFTKKISWQYQGTDTHPFYSYDCGSCERLPNGNTMITESNCGRAFEVTKEKQIVWEFYSPHRSGQNKELISSLFEMVRIAPDYNIKWLTGIRKSNSK